MIHDAASLPVPGRLRADLAVVGSGPGGSAVAMVAAEAGLRVVVLEAGELVTPDRSTQREEEMVPRLYCEAGTRGARNGALRVHQGHGVGGSSLHNFCVCKRIPPEIRAEWARTRGLERLPPAAWDALYTEVEGLLGVQTIPSRLVNAHNRLLEAGCRSLGWRGGELRHNRTGCVESGFCELGCAYDAKNNALKVLLPRALRAGAELIARCQAVRLVHSGGRVQGLEALALDASGRSRGPVTVTAPRVALAASATGTAALLQRSEVPDPGGGTGRGLHLHPAAAVAGLFDRPVRAWQGIPQSRECAQWLDPETAGGHRTWIVPAFAHPLAFATLLPGHGREHRRWMEAYPRLAALAAVLHDRTAGTVRPSGDRGLELDYWPDAADQAELAFGLAACARLLFAAGARQVLLPTRPPRVLESPKDAENLGFPITPESIELTAVHPMGTVPMGDDPRRAPVSSAGRHHHLAGLWVADGSLFPSSIGVPPQLSVYALGLHVGRALVAEGRP